MRALSFILFALTGLLTAAHWGEPAPLLIEPVSASIKVKSDPVAAPGYPHVRRVLCYRSNKAGTAFRISPTQMISAAHVTSGEGCTVDGLPITAMNDGASDWSLIDLPGQGQGIPINCDGFVPGKWYYAIGYANGAPWQTVVPLYATVYKSKNGQRVLIGLAIPGMSGGPLIDDSGRTPGIVNARLDEYGVSFSRELKDTALCRA